MLAASRVIQAQYVQTGRHQLMRRHSRRRQPLGKVIGVCEEVLLEAPLWWATLIVLVVTLIETVVHRVPPTPIPPAVGAGLATRSEPIASLLSVHRQLPSHPSALKFQVFLWNWGRGYW